MRWSQSTHDLGAGPTWRSDADLRDLVNSAQWQRDQGNTDPGYVQQGQGTDHSLVAIAKALDAANLQGGHGGEHAHAHAHDHAHVPGEEGHVHYGAVDPARLPATDWGREPRLLEHPDERTDANAHNWGAGRVWREGDPYPAPIISSLPVRSRSRGRWDADGM
jgi:hypothetical protein